MILYKTETGELVNVEQTKATENGNNSDYLSKSNQDEYTPTSDYHPATKKYVDDSIVEVLDVVKTGTLLPKGTIAFTNLPPLTSAETGDMYNISDQFTTNSDFAEGSGNVIPAGSNVYKTADGQWDVLAGSPVTGVKGNTESTYRSGNVNITPEDIGLEKVGNFKSVSTVASQGLSNTEKENARGNIDAVGNSFINNFSKKAITLITSDLPGISWSNTGFLGFLMPNFTTINSDISNKAVSRIKTFYTFSGGALTLGFSGTSSLGSSFTPTFIQFVTNYNEYKVIGKLYTTVFDGFSTGQYKTNKILAIEAEIICGTTGITSNSGYHIYFLSANNTSLSICTSNGVYKASLTGYSNYGTSVVGECAFMEVEQMPVV